MFAVLVEPPVGILGDIWRRRFLIVAGGGVFAVSTLLTAASGGFWLLLLSFTLFFPASGAFVSLSQATLMDWAPDRREQNMSRWAFAGSVGAALGPIALRWILGQQPRTLRLTIGPAFFMVGGFYLALSAAPTLLLAALAVLLAHFGGSVLWVFSTVLLQMEVPDRFRGRVFAAELAMVTLMSSLSSYWTGYGLDRAGWSPERMAFVLGLLFCLPGALWLVVTARWRESRPLAAPTPVLDDESLETRIG